MCGRFSLLHSADEVENIFGVAGLEQFPPRYNIAPTQPIMTISAGLPRLPGSNLPERDALLMRWGLLPSWVKDTSDFPLLINARSETAATKVSFRNAMRHRRILIPASGFYEWQRDKDTGERQAYWVKPKNGTLIGFAGLAETYMNSDGAEIDTAAFLTAPANKEFSSIHHRMPIAIAEADFERWLDCRNLEPRHVTDLMHAPDEGMFEAIAISDAVNKFSNTGPEIQTPVEPKDFTQKKKRPENSQGSLF